MRAPPPPPRDGLHLQALSSLVHELFRESSKLQGLCIARGRPSGVCWPAGVGAGEGQELCCSSGLLVLTQSLSLAALSWGDCTQ